MPDFTFNKEEAYRLSKQVPSVIEFGESSTYSGFSLRLNQMLDVLTIYVPVTRGRKRWLAAVSSCHDKQSQYWLEEDKIPKINRLRALIVFFMMYMPDHIKPASNTDLEIWLLYGVAGAYKPEFRPPN